MRGYFISIFIITLMLLTTGIGCGTKKPENKNENLPGAADARAQRNRNDFFSSSTLNRIQGDNEDLTVGKKVVIMGSTNSDGTITAQQIMIGEMPSFTGMFATGTRERVSSVPNGDNHPQFQPPAEGILPPEGVQFQRRAEENNGNWGSGDRSSEKRTHPTRMSGQAMIVGEILKKDKVSLIIKVTDGGSKIVFYSDKTEIFFLQPPVEKPK